MLLTKLHANENFPLETVLYLRNLGYDVLFKPIRSILYRSAASLAVECLMYKEGELLIQQGLSSDTPLDVKNDFIELKEKFTKNY